MNFKNIDMSDPSKRGFDPGDDDKLQAATKGNLQKQYQEYLTEGNTVEAEKIKKEIDALEEAMELDKKTDPNDETPDKPMAG